MEKRFIAIALLFCSFFVKSQQIIQDVDRYMSLIDTIQYVYETKSEIIKNFEKNTEGMTPDNRFQSELDYVFSNNHVRLISKLKFIFSKIERNYSIQIDSLDKCDLILYNNQYNPVAYVECAKDESPFYELGLPSFAKQYSIKRKKTFKMILKMDIRHLLISDDLPQTVLYIQNSKFFVYSIMNQRIYELDSYIRDFLQTEIQRTQDEN